jgi:protein tyrosine phosphatase (PTP) superfamily phosphohydrolase (DUF442 family)
MSAGLEAIYQFRRMDAGLATAGQPSEVELGLIAAAGFERVVNLALHDAEYALDDEAGRVRALGMAYIHLPVAFHAPARADFEQFRRLMRAQAGRRLFLHCAANKRVSAFLGLYRLLELGWSRAQAFALMDTVWTPDETWARFIDQLAP